VLSQALAIIVILAITSGCNMPSKEKQQDSQYASQSQGLRGDAGGPLAGTPRLEYDHHFQFAKGDAKVDLTITGEIPLTPTSSSKMVFECSESRKGETEVQYVYQWTGSGKVNIGGTADWTASSSGCLCSLDDTIEVKIQGVEFPAWGKPVSGGSCQVVNTALKVTETWNTAPAWQCTCKTPEDVEKMHLEENLAAFSSWGNPDLEKMTMIFESTCPGDSNLVENLDPRAEFGTGDYWWTFHSGQNEGPDRYKIGPSMTQWAPGMSSEPVSCAPGEWGPPLESIMAENPVPAWEPIQ
jgi:hypothetical protein